MDLHAALDILRLEVGCTPRHIRRAYIDLVKVWDPDRFPAGSPQRSTAEQRLKEINRAYAVAIAAMHGAEPSASSPPVQLSKPAGNLLRQPAPAQGPLARVLDGWTRLSTTWQLAIVIGALALAASALRWFALLCYFRWL